MFCAVSASVAVRTSCWGCATPATKTCRAGPTPTSWKAGKVTRSSTAETAAYLFFLFGISWKLTLVAAIALPPMLGLWGRFRKRLRAGVLTVLALALIGTAVEDRLNPALKELS